MKKIVTVLMLVGGFTALNANGPELGDFESFKDELNSSVSRERDNNIGKSLEDQYYSIDLAAVAQIALTPFVALYYGTGLPKQVSYYDMIGINSCYNSRIWLAAQLYKAKDDEVKRDQLIQDFKSEYERCSSLSKTITEKIEQSKK